MNFLVPSNSSCVELEGFVSGLGEETTGYNREHSAGSKTDPGEEWSPLEAGPAGKFGSPDVTPSSCELLRWPAVFSIWPGKGGPPASCGEAVGEVKGGWAGLLPLAGLSGRVDCGSVPTFSTISPKLYEFVKSVEVSRTFVLSEILENLRSSQTTSWDKIILSVS